MADRDVSAATLTDELTYFTAPGAGTSYLSNWPAIATRWIRPVTSQIWVAPGMHASFRRQTPSPGWRRPQDPAPAFARRWTGVMHLDQVPIAAGRPSQD